MKKHIITFLILMYSIGIHSQIGGQVNFSINDLEITSHGEFVELSLPNSIPKSEIGTPELPYIIQSFVVPINANVTGIRINSLTKNRIPGHYYIYPQQPPIPVGENEYNDRIFKMDTVLYNSQLPFPNSLVKIISDEYEFGYHIVTIGICPIEYIPTAKEVYICNIGFSIEYTSILQKKELGELPKQSQIQKDLVINHIRGLVKNPDDVENMSPVFSIASQSKGITIQDDKKIISKSGFILDEIVPQYIIITNNDLKPIFQKLASWKIKKGIPTMIKTTEEIIPHYQGVDVPEKIRNFLIEANSKWGTGLFVLLGGNTDIIPARMVEGSGSKDWPTDLYYATTKETWYDKNARSRFSASSNGHDFYLGRAPVKNVLEAQTFVNKILLYEKADVENKNYYNNSLIATGFLDYTDCKEYYTTRRDQIRYNQYKGQFKQYKSGIPDNIKNNTILMFDNHDCSGSAYVYRNVEKYCKSLNGNSLEDVYSPEKPYSPYCITGDYEFNKDNFLSALNNTQIAQRDYFHTIFHLDHSNISSLGVSSKDKGLQVSGGDVSQLENGSYLQIMYSLGCKPATFSYDCLGSKYLTNPNGGGVAFIGNSDDGYYSEHPDLRNFYNALYNEQTPFSIGYVFRNTPLSNSSGKRRLTLLGDPEMQVWTATPQTLDVTDSVASATPGKVKVDVKVNNLPPGKTATLCLMKGDEAYRVEQITDTNLKSFEITSHSSDSIYVTVTAHNYIPYLDTIADPTSYNTNVFISDLVFKDDRTGNSKGNGDGQLDAGETVELSVSLKNRGTSTANNVSAKLSSSHTGISVESTTSSFGNIAANGTQTSVVKFRFKIDKDMADVLKNDQNPITFNLEITDGAGTKYYDKFNVDVFAPKMELRSQTISYTSNGNSTIELGETVRMKIYLFNSGKSEAVGLKAKLISKTTGVSVSIAQTTYNTIKYKETKPSVGEFVFTVPSGYVVNSPLIFDLEVENEFGRKDSFNNFNLLDRPGMITSVNTESASTEIVLKWDKPTGETILGYNVWRSNDIDGAYDRLNDFILPNAYFRDYGLNGLTSYYYKISAVSKSGNEGNRSGSFQVWTTLPTVGLFPVSMNLNPTVMTTINVADVNNDGKKEIFLSAAYGTSGFLIGLDNEGVDLFNIDNNPTTTSGFADLGTNTKGSVALGDLFGTGEMQVVSATREDAGRTPNYVRVYSTVKKDKEQHMPDCLWTLTYAPGTTFFDTNPVLANVDNDPGTLEIVLSPTIGGEIFTLKNDGTKLDSIFVPRTSWNTSSIAVSDLNDDGHDEVIIGADDGVYVRDYWNDDFYRLYSRTGYTFQSPPVVADIDNDGKKEILIKGWKTGTDENYLHVINLDGQLVNGWGTQSQITIGKASPSPQYISVGNLNNDPEGKLKIVALGQGSLKIWDHRGILLNEIPIETNNTDYGISIAPILADIDGDDEIEILIASNKKSEIGAKKINGADVAGFPISVDDYFRGSPCVADLDGDGKSEIIAATNGKVYAWATNGDANRIEWGSERHDHYNTGEYYKVCDPVVIRSNTLWNTNQDICGNIVIESGVSLTLSSNAIINMGRKSMIIIKSGANLIVDGGKIYNVNLKALSGSSVTMKNNAYMKLKKNGQFEIQNGSTFDNQYGTIDKAF